MTTITIKRSSTASAIPLAGDLAVGELAVNLEDKRLFTKQSDGTVIELSTNPTDLDAATLRIDGVEITASATELNKLDGFTGSTTELNLLDGLTATTIELNTLDGITASTAELNKLDGYTGSTAELNILDGVTATTAELNKLDGFTGTVDDLNYAKDLRATGVTTAELDVLDGITATTAELNYTDGVTSNIQTQLNAMVEKSGDTMTGDLSLGDSVKAKFGTSDDLQIYHDGFHSNIKETGAGSLIIDAANTIFRNSDASKTYSVMTDGGSIDLYHNNSKKLATTSTGVDVTGTVTADGLTVDGNAEISGTNRTLTFFEDDETDLNTRFRQNNGVLLVRTTNDAGTSDTTRLRIDHATGDVQFYEDTGSTAKFHWDSSAESLGIGTSSPSYQLTIEDSTDAIMQLKGSDLGRIYFGDSASDNVGRIQYYHIDNSMQFYTNGTKQATIDSSGNVGIGTASPSATLETVGSIRANNGNFERYSSTGSAVVWDLAIGTTSQFRMRLNGDTGIQYSKVLNNNYGALAVRDNYTNNQPAYTFLTDTNTGIGNASGSDDTLNFITGGSERARIDSSGNLLVGKTSNSIDTVGGLLRKNGQIGGCASNSYAGVFARNGTDGDIALFRQDGTTVGSIGTTTAGNFAFYSPSEGGIETAAVGIMPMMNGVRADAQADLGYPNARWKHLYLSGGVHLGGTGTANRLEDYEEGVWDVHIKDSHDGSTKVSAPTQGRYTKIGNIVHLIVEVYANGMPSTTFVGYPYITLPFNVGSRGGAAATTQYLQGMGAVTCGFAPDNQSQLRLATDSENPLANIATGANIGGSVRFYASVTYRASA